jgi:hypothetical protein
MDNRISQPAIHLNCCVIGIALAAAIWLVTSRPPVLARIYFTHYVMPLLLLLLLLSF